MIDFSLWELLEPLLVGAGWTLLLSATAFAGGGILGFLLMLLRVGRLPLLNGLARLYVELFQGTPLLVQLFIIFFGLPVFGIEPSAFAAAAMGLALFSAAYLGEIWRGSVQSVARVQWEASASLAMSFGQQLRYVILPQAYRISVPPTVGFMVQVVKATSLTAVVGFIELTRTGMNLSNSTFRPFLIYGLVGALYFILCAPLSAFSRRLEARLGKTAR
jgi:polar amino acid transport system permease protein